MLFIRTDQTGDGRHGPGFQKADDLTEDFFSFSLFSLVGLCPPPARMDEAPSSLRQTCCDGVKLLPQLELSRSGLPALGWDLLRDVSGPCICWDWSHRSWYSLFANYWFLDSLIDWFIDWLVIARIGSTSIRHPFSLFLQLAGRRMLQCVHCCFRCSYTWDWLRWSALGKANVSCEVARFLSRVTQRGDAISIHDLEKANTQNTSHRGK